MTVNGCLHCSADPSPASPLTRADTVCYSQFALSELAGLSDQALQELCSLDTVNDITLGIVRTVLQLAGDVSATLVDARLDGSAAT